jgi:hypothetical protein
VCAPWESLRQCPKMRILGPERANHTPSGHQEWDKKGPMGRQGKLNVIRMAYAKQTLPLSAGRPEQSCRG